MKSLTFQARRFAWTPAESGLSDDGPPAGGAVENAVVAFVHAEAKDEAEGERARVVRHAVKHMKWLAGKRSLRCFVLHSFTHLGGATASPEFAASFLDEVAERLRGAGHEVQLTPFGWSCEWQLEVFGEAIAKVWKEA